MFRRNTIHHRAVKRSKIVFVVVWLTSYTSVFVSINSNATLLHSLVESVRLASYTSVFVSINGNATLSHSLVELKRLAR